MLYLFLDESQPLIFNVYSVQKPLMCNCESVLHVLLFSSVSVNKVYIVIIFCIFSHQFLFLHVYLFADWIVLFLSIPNFIAITHCCQVTGPCEWTSIQNLLPLMPALHRDPGCTEPCPEHGSMLSTQQGWVSSLRSAQPSGGAERWTDHFRTDGSTLIRLGPRSKSTSKVGSPLRGLWC